MIKIKFRKPYFYCLCLVFIGLAVSLSSVTAYRPPLDYTSRKPYYIYTFLGTYKYGDEISVKYPNDGNVYHCEGKYYKLGSIGVWPFKIPIYAWQVGCSGFLDDPGSGYQNNAVTIRYRYVGAYPMHIVIYYVGGGSTVKYVSSTGSSYVQVTYSIGSYRVYGISFDHKTSPTTKPYIYIDYVIASYEM